LNLQRDKKPELFVFLIVMALATRCPNTWGYSGGCEDDVQTILAQLEDKRVDRISRKAPGTFPRQDWIMLHNVDPGGRPECAQMGALFRAITYTQFGANAIRGEGDSWYEKLHAYARRSSGVSNIQEVDRF
jgi:hypothetical protein